MDDTITTIYCLCDDFLKAINRFDDPQVRLTTAEVMTVPLVAATFFGANIDKTRRFLGEYGYMPNEPVTGPSALAFYMEYVCCDPWIYGAVPGDKPGPGLDKRPRPR